MNKRKILVLFVILGFLLFSHVTLTASSEEQILDTAPNHPQQEVATRGCLIGIIWGTYNYKDEWHGAMVLDCNQGDLKVFGVFPDVRPWLETRAMAAEIWTFMGRAEGGSIFGIVSGCVLYWTEY